MCRGDLRSPVFICPSIFVCQQIRFTPCSATEKNFPTTSVGDGVLDNSEYNATPHPRATSGQLCQFPTSHSSLNPRSSLNSAPHTIFSPHILHFPSKCAIIISKGGLIREKTLFRHFYELFRFRHDNLLGRCRYRPRFLFY